MDARTTEGQDGAISLAINFVQSPSDHAGVFPLLFMPTATARITNLLREGSRAC